MRNTFKLQAYKLHCLNYGHRKTYNTLICTLVLLFNYNSHSKIYMYICVCVFKHSYEILKKYKHNFGSIYLIDVFVYELTLFFICSCMLNGYTCNRLKFHTLH